MSSNKLIKKIILIFCSICFINISYAENINSTNICIHYVDIDKKIEFSSINKEAIKNDLKIMTELKNIEKKEIPHCVYLSIKGRPDIYFKNFKIEVHAGTIFINGKGIGLSQGATIISDIIMDYVVF